MKLKRILALAMVLVLALSFSACGKVKELTEDELIEAAKEAYIEGYPEKTIGEYFEAFEGYSFVTAYQWFVLDAEQIETFKLDVDEKKEDALMYMMNMELDSGETSLAGFFVRNKKTGELTIVKSLMMSGDDLSEVDIDKYMELITE